MSIDNIHDLTWTDAFGAYAVCPNCHGVMILMFEDTEGRQEWLCESSCWHVFNENGRFLRQFRRQGMEQQTCPECGDFRLDRDPYDGSYYCRNCAAAFREVTIETSRDENGQPIGFRVADLGPVERPTPCPNCGDRLRAQFFQTPAGDVWAYPCRVCGIVYRERDKRLAIPPACPRCGSYALFRYTDHSAGEFQECEICHVRFDADGDYLDDADRPTEGQRQSGNYSIGTAPASPKIGG